MSVCFEACSMLLRATLRFERRKIRFSRSDHFSWRMAMPLKWLAKQAIIGAIAAQCSSYPAAAQSGPITVTSNDAKCGYESGPGTHFKFRCDGNALIVDTDKDQFIACNYIVYSEYEPKVGGGGPTRYVISSILSPSGGFCYIQQPGLTIVEVQFSHSIAKRPPPTTERVRISF